MGISPAGTQKVHKKNRPFFVLSFENKKKNKFSFYILLTYSYLCKKIRIMDVIHIIAVVVLIICGALIYRKKNNENDHE